MDGEFTHGIGQTLSQLDAKQTPYKSYINTFRLLFRNAFLF